MENIKVLPKCKKVRDGNVCGGIFRLVTRKNTNGEPKLSFKCSKKTCQTTKTFKSVVGLEDAW